MDTAEEFMSLVYDPATSSAKSVEGLLAPDCVFAGGNMPQVGGATSARAAWEADPVALHHRRPWFQRVVCPACTAPTARHPSSAGIPLGQQVTVFIFSISFPSEP